MPEPREGLCTWRKRLSGRRKAVTIIAGFKSYEGIVICADTQETVEHAKRNVPKLRFEPANHAKGSTDDLAALFCGSSNDGPYVDKLIENAWESAQTATSLDEACAEIESSIKRTYQEFGRIYQRGYCPTAELIFGVKMFNGARLFSAYGPVVNEKQGFDSSGIGHYMVDFLAGRMYRDYLNLHQCVILAAYILFQAKEHVEGCGGQSQIAVLRREGTSGLVDSQHIETITELLQFTDDETGRILLDMANIDLNESEVREHVNSMMDGLLAVREARKDRLRDLTAFWNSFGGLSNKTDSLGLLMPSNEKKSEPEDTGDSNGN